MQLLCQFFGFTLELFNKQKKKEEEEEEVRDVYNNGGESSRDMMEGAAVQSQLAGYLMSLVIGLLWPPRIPALLLLMCAGTERATACTPSRSSHLYFPSIHRSGTS